MKKIYLCLVFIFLVSSMLCFSQAAQFYDTLDTKYESPTEILHMLGIVDGVSENIYSPKRTVTRAEMAKLLICAYKLDGYLEGLPSGQNTFKDVKKSDWFYDYVSVCADAGFINGYEDGTFRPNETVTYGEACAMIVKALGYGIIHAPSGQSWDQGYINKAVELRITKNVGAFKNTEGASRGNIAIMIWNMLNTDTYIVVKEKTNIGIIKETIPHKFVDMYYPNYYIIDEEIVTNIHVLKELDEKEKEIDVTYIRLEDIGDIKMDKNVPLKYLGTRVSGIYNRKTKEATGINFIYNENFDEGTYAELKEDYRLNKKVNVYSFGSDKAYVYIYFNQDKTVNRMVYLGSDEDYVVESAKVQKEKDKPAIVEINEEIYIDESTVLVNSAGEVRTWASVKKGDVVSKLNNGMYVVNSTTISGKLDAINNSKDRLLVEVNGKIYECDDNARYSEYNSKMKKPATYKNLKDNTQRKVDLVTNYAGKVLEIKLSENYENASNVDRFGIITGTSQAGEGKNARSYIEIFTQSGKKRYLLPDDIAKATSLTFGTLIGFEADNSKIVYIEVLKNNKKFYDSTFTMNLKSKTYDGETFGGYKLLDTTVVYTINKNYVMNSDTDIESYELAVVDKEILETLKDEPVHIVYTNGNELSAVFIEKDVNKFVYKYGRVLEIFEEKDGKKNKVLKIKVSPFNTTIATYKVDGILKCEVGDIISYESSKESLTVKEVYSAKKLGDPKDLIVEKVENKIVYCTNGDKIDLNKDIFKANGKQYNINDYHLTMAKVSDIYDEWRFTAGSFVTKAELKISVGDRIAIDEIEDLIIVYRGYIE